MMDDGRRTRMLQFISLERKKLFTEVMEHATRMQGEAISEIMPDLIVLNRLEDEARTLTD